MDVIDGPRLPTDAGPPTAPVWVFLEPDSRDRLVEAARWLGADPTAAEYLLLRRHRRPLAHVDGRRISVVAFAPAALGLAAEVHLHAAEHGLLVICPPEVAGPIRRAIAAADGEPEDALVAALLSLAQLSEDVIERLTEAALALDGSSSGLASGAQRRKMSRVRAQLFALQQLWSAHRHVLSSDDPLADLLGDDGRRQLRRAQGIFDTCATAAAQLYALLGDTLSRQSTVINERLTLVAVIFFPLTVSTGFFGMNFGWMTANIGSPGAFVLLGIVLPVVLVGVTLFGARWLTRE